MSLINCQVELKLRRTKNLFLSVVANDNDGVNLDNIIFAIKDTNLYVPVITLSANDNQKLSKILSKGFEISVYWNEYKTKMRIKIRQMSIDIFLNQSL